MNTPSPQPTIAVIGAGWAGLAAALYLAERGVQAELFEAAPQAGGRARRLDLDVNKQGFILDNGQHLLVGAYRDTLRIVTALGGASSMRQLPMQLNSTAGMRLKTARLPAPLHLLAGLITCQGLSLRSRAQMLKFMLGLRIKAWRTKHKNVEDLLLAAGQGPELVEAIWRPLCLATMNTDINAACAQTFVNVLRDTLGARRTDSDFVVSELSLGDLFVDPVLARLEQLKAPIHLRQPIRQLQRAPGGWRIKGPATDMICSQIILAVPPTNAAELLGELENTDLIRQDFARFAYEPIATTYLWWDESSLLRQRARLPAWTQLQESVEQACFGQWCFDRGVQHGLRIAGVVVSAAARALLRQSDSQSDRDRLGQAIAAQVVTQMGLPPALVHRTFVEKRGTIRCTADRPRLAADALAELQPGLWLAGDYVWHQYPATLEGAVRSGEAAAAACLPGGADPVQGAV